MYMYDILIIDSGISMSHVSAEKAEKKLPDTYYISESGAPCINENQQDEIGHGTAVYSMIACEAPDAKIGCVKIFDDDFCVNEERLLHALRYIYEHIPCRIINMSLGICSGNCLPQLEEICKKLTDRATIIVSAFDNQGGYSYPAAFDTVIGVDNWYQCQSADKFEYVCNRHINIRAKGGLQRVKWKNGQNIVIGGSSFACAHMSACIFNIIKNEKIQPSLPGVLKLLQERATYVYRTQDESRIHAVQKVPFSIKRAVLFPFNKEMHQLVRFANTLPFQITAIYDMVQSGRVGVRSDKIVLRSQSDASAEYVIRNISNISYDEFDTMILGHMDEINRICGYDLRAKIIADMRKAGKNVYAFDPIESSSFPCGCGSVFSPAVACGDIENSFGKLFQIHRPVICVCGTSSVQGKFTLQIILRRLFLHAGYSVGEIGTEPHALLFGMDYVYPMGYASPIRLDDWQAISVLNYMEHMLDQRDVILTGTQANTIPLNHDNLSAISVRNNSFLLGINPDVMIVCVNPDDDMEYILNTIKYVEGYLNCAAVAIVVYPIIESQDWRSAFDLKVPLSEAEYAAVSQSISAAVRKPVFMLGNAEHMNRLFDVLVNYLSSEE